MKLVELINRPVVLDKTVIKFLLNVGVVEASARAILRLSPKPKLVIEFDLPSDAYEASNEIRSKPDVKITLAKGQEITALVGDYYLITSDKVSGVLVPEDQPLTVLNVSAAIYRCKFAVINLTNLWGSEDIKFSKDGRNLITQHFKIETFPWLIEITGVNRVMSLDLKMRLEGGSAITHCGSIRRTDGLDFDSAQLVPLLEALHLFLSFVRGSYCGLALISGRKASGKRVWQQWGTYKVEPWKRPLPGWAPLSQSESLSLVFQGFWDRLNDAQWGETVTKVMNWYLRSNESDEAEVGIILTQSALESLTFKTVGKKPKGTTEGAWIASALRKMGIDEKLPPECCELLTLQNRFNWTHGPHALVKLRNNLIHADNRLGHVNSDAHWEAWNFGQWCVEMMLLKLFNYTGEYTNRIIHGREHTPKIQVIPVPWAPPKT
ncbi:MAG: hypothetical protein F4Z29_01260 [Gemmatimonadetes bacterium]|nr:hypothetical protein [Gemmatimonadota bacterium]